MAKRRRNKKKSNLPKAVLDRARENAGIDDDVEEDIEEEEEVVSASEASSVSERAARRRKKGSVQAQRTRQRGDLTNEMVEEILANPTIFVSEEELQQEYQHVLVDLRNMAILSAVLIVVLVALNFVL